MDPYEEDLSAESEYGWGLGIFAPGVANNEGQSQEQEDFGANYGAQGLSADGMTGEDIYARAVADRRTDPTDPSSGRDFESLGNPDRFGPNPPLVREAPQSTKSQRRDNDPGLPPLQRKW
jgi:hypothetical protein